MAHRQDQALLPLLSLSMLAVPIRITAGMGMGFNIMLNPELRGLCDLRECGEARKGFHYKMPAQSALLRFILHPAEALEVRTTYKKRYLTRIIGGDASGL